MKKFAFIAVMVVVVVGLKFYNRSGDQKDVLTDMRVILASLDVTPEVKTCLGGSLNRVHESAFDAAYSMGGRRRAASFDNDKYLDQVFNALVADCAAGDQELSDFLRQVRTEIVVE